MSKNRAFVRYSKKGILAPGSLVVTKNYPDRSQNMWYEVPTHLLGGSVTFETTVDTTTFPWAYALNNAVELSMGCMSNQADYLDVYAPLTTGKSLANPIEMVSLMNEKLSFLGTFEVGKLDGVNQTIQFNLSPQLMSSLVKPQDASPSFCGYGISFYID